MEYWYREFIEKASKQNFNEPDFQRFDETLKRKLGKYLRRAYNLQVLFLKFIRSEYIRHKLIEKVSRETSKYYRNLNLS